MGHYDDCRETEEDLRTEKRGAKLRDLIINMSNKDAGILFECIKSLHNITYSLNGTFDQHQSMQYNRKIISEKLKNWI